MKKQRSTQMAAQIYQKVLRWVHHVIAPNRSIWQWVILLITALLMEIFSWTVWLRYCFLPADSKFLGQPTHSITWRNHPPQVLKHPGRKQRSQKCEHEEFLKGTWVVMFRQCQKQLVLWLRQLWQIDYWGLGSIANWQSSWYSFSNFFKCTSVFWNKRIFAHKIQIVKHLSNYFYCQNTLTTK